MGVNENKYKMKINIKRNTKKYKMSHEKCKFCVERTLNNYTCYTCGSKYLGKHFDYDKKNFCTVVCMNAKMEYDQQVQQEKEDSNVVKHKYFNKCYGGGYM